MFLKISHLSQENTCVAALGLQLYWNETTPTQFFSGEVFEIFKNNFLTGHLQWLLLKNDSSFLFSSLFEKSVAIFIPLYHFPLLANILTFIFSLYLGSLPFLIAVHVITTLLLDKIIPPLETRIWWNINFL